MRCDRALMKPDHRLPVTVTTACTLASGTGRQPCSTLRSQVSTHLVGVAALRARPRSASLLLRHTPFADRGGLSGSALLTTAPEPGHAAPRTTTRLRERRRDGHPRHAGPQAVLGSPALKRSAHAPAWGVWSRGTCQSRRRFDALSQTSHLQSVSIRARALHSEVKRELSPRKPEEIRDHPSRSVALDLFQRSQVHILPPLQRNEGPDEMVRAFVVRAGRAACRAGRG